MHGRSRPTALLPRLVGGSGRAPALGNALGLLGAALVGAGLVHLAAYHIPTGLPLDARWFAEALTLLAQCPLRGPLGLVAAVAVLAPLLAARELWRLRRREAALARLLAARNLAVPPGHDTVPRSPRRLLIFVAALLGLQALWLGAAGLLYPMPAAMPRSGATMVIPSSCALSLGLMHLAVAAVLGLLLWRVERGLTCLRAAVATQLRLLRGGDACSAVRPRAPYAARLPRSPQGHSLFARPPPIAA